MQRQSFLSDPAKAKGIHPISLSEKTISAATFYNLLYDY
jgi:hypothetical protein